MKQDEIFLLKMSISKMIMLFLKTDTHMIYSIQEILISFLLGNIVTVNYFVATIYQASVDVQFCKLKQVVQT